MCGKPEICVLNCLIMNNGDTDEPHNPDIDVIPYCVHKIIPEEVGVFVDYLTAQVFVRNQNIQDPQKYFIINPSHFFFFFISNLYVNQGKLA